MKKGTILFFVILSCFFLHYLGQSPTAFACIPKTCAQLGASCGLIDDTCGNLLNCGVCPVGYTCNEQHYCDFDCVPKTCAQLGASCGPIDDTCGNLLNCGVCPVGYTCNEEHYCDFGCAPKTCAQLEASCGFIDDTCGNLLDCGMCNLDDYCNSEHQCVSCDDCDDGDLCNGTEICDPNTDECVAGQPLDCDDGIPCSIDDCDPQEGCIHSFENCPEETPRGFEPQPDSPLQSTFFEGSGCALSSTVHPIQTGTMVAFLALLFFTLIPFALFRKLKN